MMEVQDQPVQANLLTTDDNATSDKPQKPRHRASVACTSCREKRTRCVILAGESECTQCKSNGRTCVVNNDDERRKPSSKAYMTSLTDRITHLENLLREKDQAQQSSDAPQGNAPRIAAKSDQHSQDVTHPAQRESVAQPHHAPSTHSSEVFPSGSELDGVSPKSSSSYGGSSMVSKLLSSTGHLSFDQLSGRLRYFGPVANCHVHSELKSQNDDASRQALEQQRRAEKAIRSISLDTHDYLMNLFWEHYNAVLHVVHRAAFEEGREAGRGPYYSGFLHICLLAAGYKFCQKDRPDMIRISLPDKESTLQREAKYMLEYEIEQPGGIPSIVALLLLGDLETGSGRDNLGWLYSGMANRLCFDIGLHLDASNTGASQRDIEIGRMTLWACIVYDKYWALFLGRPTMMKPSDLEVYRLSTEFERLGTSYPAGVEKSRETQVYEALLDLMELAGKITEIMDQASRLSTNIDHHVYFRMSALHRELESWYSRLPVSLQWNAENIATAPFSFFLLHQQYSATLILLHRPFARYTNQPADQIPSGESSEDDSDTLAGSAKALDPTNHFSALSRTICTQHAVRIAKIFWQHRQRFDTRQIFVTGLQHAGTAATALVAALAYVKDRSTRNNNMQYLECLAAALQDMSHTYVPAEKMSNVLGAVIVELRDAVPEQTRTVPARRRSSHHEIQQHRSSKRHQSFHNEDRSRLMDNDMQGSAQLPNFAQPSMSSLPSQKMLGSQYQTSSGQATAFTQQHTAQQGDGWTMAGQEKQTSNGVDWPSLAHGTTSFGSSFNQQSRPTFARSQSDINPIDEHPSDNLQMTADPGQQNLNFTQYRSNNAWMGAETPTISFSPPPASQQMTGSFQGLHHQRSQYSQRAPMNEIQDITFTDFVGLLNPDDRLDFGSLGLPTGFGTGFTNGGLDNMSGGLDSDLNTVGEGTRNTEFSRPPLPTPKPTPIVTTPNNTNQEDTVRSDSGIGTRDQGFNGPDDPSAGNFTRSRSQSECDTRTFSKTMAGLADILRRGNEGR